MDAVTNSWQTAKRNLKQCMQDMPSDIAKTEKKLFSIIGRSKADPIRRLTELYTFMDRYLGFVQQYTACGKGCDLCCRIPVSVTELDIMFIERSTSIQGNISRSMPILAKSPCPFLIAGVCSIYRFRPFVCRRNVSFDRTPMWCHAEMGADVPMPAMHLSSIDEVYRLLVESTGSTKIYDIRRVFG